MGGGYQETCTACNVPFLKKFAPPADKQMSLHDLRAMGIHHKLQIAAQQIGPDVFLQVWMVFGALFDDGHRLRINMPRFRTYLRTQRNNYVRALRDAGMSVDGIQKKIELDLDEKLDKKWIYKICGRPTRW